MEPGSQAYEVYFHVRAGISLIYGLSLTHLLRGVVRMVPQPKQRTVYPVHLLWVISTFLLIAHFWWWEVNITLVPRWSYARYLYVIFYASLFYFLSALLSPDEMERHGDYRTYFFAKQRWIFGALALIFLVDIYDTLMKGGEHFASLGVEYPVRIAAYVATCSAAMFIRNERFHTLFAVAFLLYQISWMLRRYHF